MARSNIHLGVSGSRRQPEQMVEIIIPRQSSGEPQATCLNFSQWTAYKAGIWSMWRQLLGPGGAGGGGVEEGSRRLLTGHAVTLAVRKHRLSQGAKTKARERFLVIHTQFSAYRLQHIICLATAQHEETLCYLISLFLLAVSIRNVRRNPWCSKCPMQILREEEPSFPAIFRMRNRGNPHGDGWAPSFRCPQSFCSVHDIRDTALLIDHYRLSESPCPFCKQRDLLQLSASLERKFPWWYFGGNKAFGGRILKFTFDNVNGFKNHYPSPTTDYIFTLIPALLCIASHAHQSADGKSPNPLTALDILCPVLAGQGDGSWPSTPNYIL